jgi:hypothetical protein
MRVKSACWLMLLERGSFILRCPQKP